MCPIFPGPPLLYEEERKKRNNTLSHNSLEKTPYERFLRQNLDNEKKKLDELNARYARSNPITKVQLKRELDQLNQNVKLLSGDLDHYLRGLDWLREPSKERDEKAEGLKPVPIEAITGGAPSGPTKPSAGAPQARPAAPTVGRPTIGRPVGSAPTVGRPVVGQPVGTTQKTVAPQVGQPQQAGQPAAPPPKPQVDAPKVGTPVGRPVIGKPIGTPRVGTPIGTPVKKEETPATDAATASGDKATKKAEDNKDEESETTQSG